MAPQLLLRSPRHRKRVVLTSWRPASLSPALSRGLLQACQSGRAVICHHGATLALPWPLVCPQCCSWENRRWGLLMLKHSPGADPLSLPQRKSVLTDSAFSIS